MARSCGLRIGLSRFELIVLDGSPKKHKITAYQAGRLSVEGDDSLAAAAAALKEAVKEHNIPRDNIGVAIDAGLSAFRTVRMPFSDNSKIEEVLKFEVESLLPQWNIDDVIVDFHVLESSSEGSELLITAVPKQDLQRILSLCEKAGLEPQEAELETTAMVNAAMAANICTPETAQILVHIGERSASLVVMDSGKVREMRAIHIGALSHEFATAPVVEEGEEESEPKPEVAYDPAEVQRRLEQAIKRIRRELGRTVSAVRTTHPIDAIYLCGLDMPSLIDTRILDVPVRVLDAFEQDGGQPAEGYGQLVVAYGVAVRQLGGGVLHPSLRREEQRYTGAFERIELPLAVVCLLAITLLAVWNIFLFKERSFVDNKLAFWRDSTRSYMLGNPKQGTQGSLVYPSDAILQYANNLNADTERNKFEQLKKIQGMLNAEIKKLEKDLGQDAEITQPQSALQGLLLVLDVFEKAGAEVGRPSLRKVVSTYQLGRSGKPDSVRVSFDISFFAADSVVATQNYENFVRLVEAQPWFVSFEKKPSDPLENGQGIFLSGIAVSVDVTKAPVPEPAASERAPAERKEQKS